MFFLHRFQKTKETGEILDLLESMVTDLDLKGKVIICQDQRTFNSYLWFLLKIQMLRVTTVTNRVKKMKTSKAKNALERQTLLKFVVRIPDK